jgi:hypothetical protein
MRYFFFLLGVVVACFASDAKVAHVRYRIEYGIVGKVAQSEITLKIDKQGNYRIDAYVSAYGKLANALTKHLREHHISTGKIIAGKFVTSRYEMYKRFGAYKTETIYRVDFKRQRVIKAYKEWKKGRQIMMDTRALGYFGTHDLLTFFLDLPKLMDLNKPGAKKRFLVVGADRKNGRVDIYTPQKKERKKYRKLLGDASKEGSYAKVIMHRKLYHSKQGELEIVIYRQGVVHKGVLEDVLFFGDVRIILESFTESKMKQTRSIPQKHRPRLPATANAL